MDISIIDKISELGNHDAHFILVIFEIFGCVKNQYFLGIVSPEPIFVFNVYFLEIFEWDLVFLWSLPELCPLITFLWSTSKIDDFRFLFGCHGFEAAVK